MVEIMEPYNYLEDQITEMEELKFSLIPHGVQCVMMAGMVEMLR